MDANWEANEISIGCFEDGYVHIFRLDDRSDAEGRVERILSVKAIPRSRVLRYSKARSEIFVGH